MADTETTRLRWFEEYSTCRQCGKRADGILRGEANDSYGPHCRKCADRRLKASAKAREITRLNDSSHSGRYVG